MRTFIKIKKDIESIIEPYKPRIRYVSYMGSAILCELSSSIAINKSIRSKIPLNKAKYLGTAIAMHLAANACQKEASRLD